MTAFLHAVIQLALDFAIPVTYGQTAAVFITIVLLDYIIPFTGLGLACIFTKKPVTGVVSVVSFRFLCHFISGITVWGQWAWEGWNIAAYSFCYNAIYMLPELVLTTAGAAILLKAPYVRKLFVSG